MGEKTTVGVEKETRTRLKVWKAQHELTYDEAINKLLNDKEDKE
jgi:hypothetical protein